ncbi:MAG TPA: HNH endonuclease, partial [Longimicrobiales bacterium]|nr:HNH endonuclease [Longimicrobiales bacterium]
ACVAYYGAMCRVCGFSFEDVYGYLGVGFIHVHHTRPLSTIREEYRIDPIRDLVPVCPNCHAMLHRTDPPLEIDELRLRIAQQS